MTSCPPHPLGVQPAGNELLARLAGGDVGARARGLGALAALDDELLLAVLEFLPARALARAGGASRALYAFAAHEDTWRALVLRDGAWDFSSFRGSWRATARAAAGAAPLPRAPPFARCGLFSAALFNAHRAAAAPLAGAWLRAGALARAPADLDAATLAARFEAGAGEPCLLEGAAAGLWPGWAPGGGAWAGAALVAAHGGARFHVGGFDVPLRDFAAYAARDASDSALILFDARFAEAAPALGAYAVPRAFREDLFALLAPGARPDHRWLIAGARKSGSCWHQDPNGTAAWNACLAGAKLWLMSPPDLTPPGVWASADGAHACAPLSVVEWLLNFWEPFVAMRDARARAARAAAGKRARDARAPAPPPVPVVGVARAGDVVFVPRGWWHAVVNVGDGLTVAVTQNFCSRAGLPAVLDFLETKPHAVSGVPPADAPLLGARFRAALAAAEPAELARADAARAAARAAAAAAARGAPSAKWARVTEAARAPPGGAAAAPFSAAALWGAAP